MNCVLAFLISRLIQISKNNNFSELMQKLNRNLLNFISKFYVKVSIEGYLLKIKSCWKTLKNKNFEKTCVRYPIFVYIR